MKRAADVVVVGAGVMGLGVAWRSALRGLKVVVIERHRPGAGASSVAAGILSPTEPAGWTGPLGRFNDHAMADWPTFAEELEAGTGCDVDFRRSGALRVCRSGPERRPLETLSELLGRRGRPHRWLDEAECRDLEPGLAPGVEGLFLPDEALVDPAGLVEALAEACRRAAVPVECGIEPVDARFGADGSLRGVRASDGSSVEAPTTILATGGWAAAGTWLPEHLRPPVRPLLGEALILAGDDRAPLCTRVLRTTRGPIAPRRAGRYWVGTTVRDAGYEVGVGAGAVLDILADWSTVLPRIRNLRLVEAVAGLRPGSPDGLPFVGPSSVPGLVLLTGHGREGLIHAPRATEAVAGLLAGKPLPDDLAAFSPLRDRQQAGAAVES